MATNEARLADQDLRDLLARIEQVHTPTKTWCLMHDDGTCNLCSGTTPIVIR